ncbi:MAG TPA: formyltransferase family protein [Gemmatimonadaceae bacterium]|nr:formyltransferase family protein [Gemmatimonadaceae bacterium]
MSADGASEVVGLVVAPYARRTRTLPAKFHHVIRRQGWPGLLAVLGGKIASVTRLPESRNVVRSGLALAPGIERIDVLDFHASEALAVIEALRPDLAVIAGTYILKESVFALPRHGSINLHSGRVPEFRGAAPAFWELYNGERAVGVTIHRVVASLDAGPVLHQEMFPLDSAPDEDPLAYIEQFKRDVLLPNGVRMLVETVRALAEGTAKETPQNHAVARTFPTPDYRDVRELRRRVRNRRKYGGTK